MARPRTTLLLLTATVHPHPGVANLRVVDPAARMQEYLSSLRFALSLPRSSVNGIILAENSGADLGPLRDAVGDRDDVELLPVLATGAETSPGRGWLETRLVADAVATSTLVRESSDPIIWKCTGRYQVRNLAAVVAAAAPAQDLWFNVRRHPERWADLWVYGATPAGIAELSHQIHRMREDDGPTERAMFDILHDLRSTGTRVSMRFGVEPRIVGVRGHDGRSYDDPVQRAKWAVRSVARRVAPRFWI